MLKLPRTSWGRPALAWLLALSLPLAAGCSSDAAADDPKAQAAPTDEDKATLAVKAYVQQNLDDLATATADLANDAPAPDADGWNATADKAAVDKMKADWVRARVAYEHIEGAIAVLFPLLDVSTDERYDGFLGETPSGDQNLFDDQGVTGIHAVERILWSDSTPERVVNFEKKLPGYKAAAFPANQQEASDFKEKLCARLATETKKMRDDFKPLALDLSAAFRGVNGSVVEQHEKLTKAIGKDSEEESRYAQYTLADMKANVEGGKAIYAAFQPWLRSKGDSGAATDKAVSDGFDRITQAYAAISGDALPAAPADFNQDTPSDADKATPFGQLFMVLVKESDKKAQGSLASDMSKAGDMLGLPQLPD